MPGSHEPKNKATQTDHVTKTSQKHSRETQPDDPDRSHDQTMYTPKTTLKARQQNVRHSPKQTRQKKSRDKTTYKYLVGIKFGAVPERLK